MGSKKILVTSALPYANGAIHFGHIAGAYLPADIFVRYKRMRGDDVIYICGTDDHGVAITISAAQAGVSPQEHVNHYHKVIKEIFDKMNIRFDNFSGTSRKHHYRISQQFFLDIDKAGYITQKETTQLYCLTCNMFLADRYVIGTCPYCGFEEARGDECGRCGKWLDPLTIKDARCKVCGNTPTTRGAKNWYLALDKLEPGLKEWISTKTHWKENVVNFVNGWFAEGLRERAITRHMSWGVPVPLPEAEGQVLYVWFDAPIGYISSTVEWAQNKGEPDLWRKYWNDPETRMVHFIGKDNIPFHCIVFPGMIMARNKVNDEKIILPENVPANEFYNLEGRQFSKSDGWIIDLEDFFANYHVDSLRYALCADMPEKKDSEFNWRGFMLHNNSELADIFGNLANRVLTFVSKNFDGKVPFLKNPDPADRELLEALEAAPAKLDELLDSFEFRKAIFEFMELCRIGNRYFDAKAPWTTLKTDKDACGTTMHVTLRLLKSLSVLCAPFMPSTAERLWEMLGCKGKVEDAKWFEDPKKPFQGGEPIGRPSILFTKVDEVKIDQEVTKLQRWAEEAKQAKESQTYHFEPLGEQITINDFAKVDLRVAQIISAERVPKADKLLLLEVDLGFEKRRIVAGIAKNYDPKTLVGRKIIMAANLAPAKIRGIESNGMLLAATLDDALTLVAPSEDIHPGAKIS